MVSVAHVSTGLTADSLKYEGRARGLRAERCFHERDPNAALVRRAATEAVGTFFLMLAATGSGLAVHRVLAQMPALGLFANAIATAGALVSLIVALGAVSGGHFNPMITFLQWLGGERKTDCTMAYIAAQIFGATAGGFFAPLVFGAFASPMAALAPSWTLAASEVLDTAGLMIVVFGCARSGRRDTAPFAVGAWIAAAIIATPSLCYANPAVALGALFADGPITLPTTTALSYVLAEVGGGLLAFVFIAMAFPRAAVRPKIEL
jgi:glycerol uptake facilitator-like aquaporin